MNKYITDVIKHLQKGEIVNFYTEVSTPNRVFLNYTEDKYILTIIDNLTGETIKKSVKNTDELYNVLLEKYSADGNASIEPEYYKHRGAPCIEIQRLFSQCNHPLNVMHYYENNILKYLYRYNRKNGLEDLLKARTYLNFLISLYTQPEGREDIHE